MKSIKIGTRNSPLALWQAREVARNLQNLNYKTEILPIVSSGDKQLDKPLYAMGISGVFTRDLDLALLNEDIDIAVHSLKDVPTQLPENVELLAYLKRDFPQDVLLRNSEAENLPLEQLKIATSSLRRRAFWSKNFPDTQYTDIRGNVQTRLKKLEEGVADATLFSLAAIKRLALNINYEIVDMISAPAQGVVVVAGRKDNEQVNEILKQINDEPTQICVTIEREFLKTLEGGCTAPIGAFAEIENDEIHFIGRLCTLDGSEFMEVNERFKYNPYINQGEDLARQILDNGGKALMEKIKTQMG